MKTTLHLKSMRTALLVCCLTLCFLGFGQPTPPSFTIWTITAPATTPAWNNGTPNATIDAIIAAPFTSGETDIIAFSLTVTDNATVIISSGTTVTLTGALIVDAGSSITFNNNANLIQDGTANLNSGNIVMKRNSSLLKRLDNTLWSSPVTGSQTLLNFSPLTLTNRFYSYNTNNNMYTAVDPATSTFATARGYLIRTPNNHPSTTATIWQGSFSGVPNNGDYSLTMVDGGNGKRFNLVGNPYPSPISAASFVAANSSNITGTLYFWRKTSNVLSPSYCSWSSLGFTSNGEAQVFDLDGVIQTGQGFFVEGTGNGTTLNFNNAMRVNNHANQFFKNSNETNSVESHRIWLNATSAGGAFSQTLIGYCANATQEADAGIDGRYVNDGDIALTSLIGTAPYVIQGRALPFQATDIVPLHFKATNAGNYTIAIDHVDGLFAENAQTILIKDNFDGTYHNLNTASYTFASAAGSFTDRFELVYQNVLDVTNNNFTANTMVVYHQLSDIVVNTGTATMAKLNIYDMSGRLLVEKKDLNATETRINIAATNQILLVEVTTIEGFKAAKKMVY